MSLKKTPEYAMHLKYHGKMVDFGGWDLPVQYEGILKEHHQVRSKAGLFDVSHMGEIDVKGEKAEDFVQYLVTNNVKKLVNNQVQYTPMCYPNGGVVDDLLIYKYSTSHYLLVVNAANTDKDYEWIARNAFEGVTVKNVSAEYVQLAIQGPLAQVILQKICDADLEQIKYYYFLPEVHIAGVKCLLSRTGYTGEDGMEIYFAAEHAEKLWEAILQAGGDEIAPIGLGARDSLRFEAKLPLYGQEMDADISPLEAGLGFFVKLDGDDFIGREALIKQKTEQQDRVQVEFQMVERGIARSHYEVQKEGQKIGWVTSGAFAPSLDKNIGLALIDRKYAEVGGEIDVMIRNKPVKGQIGKGLFYQKKTRQNG